MTAVSRAPDTMLEPEPVLTDRQAECLRYLYRYFREHAYYPTQREIAEAMGLRTTTAAVYLDPLEKKGVVTRAGRSRRNVRITPQGVRMLRRLGVALDGEQEHLQI